MVTAHELREIANNYELINLLERLKAIAIAGGTTHIVTGLTYDEESQLEKLGFSIDYFNYDSDDDYRKIIKW